MDEFKCIRCTNVPPSLMQGKSEAKTYFQQFGHIVKISLRPRHQTCLVYFETEDGTQEACERAGQYQGQQFTVEMYRSKKKKKEPDWGMDPEVQSELAAMGADVGGANKRKLQEVQEKRVKSAARKKEMSVTDPRERELLNSLKLPGASTEEKYRLLEARDKLIRLRRRNQKSVDIAKVTQGTCPDMCSEKERLMREVQHQVSLYEQNADRSMNHPIAVKQYSRSSADQEAPLPHELRDVDVLQMTMGYLMHEIMDLCENPDTNMADWYHFLWDRTRGIRKDITQQELCCLGSVELVEQCARFHIHCSARLVAEDPSVFDQKINTENLTKCLQTLKYMYHDLDVKGVKCSNEAEFRAYVILLNLNDGNFMWEVQQLRGDIQRSRQVRFALDVYSAIDKNNYVKFFKLVRSTTYLNACILFRYFMQIRQKAVKAIMKCYSPRSKTLYPIDKLVSLFAFEDLSSTIDLFEYYNLQINEDRTHVLLDRGAFALPDYPYPMDRAVHVIETKRTRTVGETVCGHESLPPPLFRNHEPQHSFDANGYLDLSEFSEEEPSKPSSAAPEMMSSVREKVASEGCDYSQEPDAEEDDEELMEEAEADDADETPRPRANVVFGGFAAIKHDMQKKRQLDAPKPAGGFQFTFNKPIVEESAIPRCTALGVPSPTFSFVKPAEIARTKVVVDDHQLKKRQEEQQQQARREAVEERKRLLNEELRLRLERELMEQREMERQLQIRRELLEKKAILEETRRRKEQQERRDREMKDARLRREQEEDEERSRQKEVDDAVRMLMDRMLVVVEDSCRTDRLDELRCRFVQRRMLTKWRRKVAANKRKRKAVEQSPLWICRKTPAEVAKELRMRSQDHLTLNLKKRYKLGVPQEVVPRQKQRIEKIDLTAIQKRLIVAFSRFQRPSGYLYWKVNFVNNSSSIVLSDYLDLKDNEDMFLEQLCQDRTRVTYCFHRIEEQLDYECHGHVFIAKRFEQIASQLRIYVQNSPQRTVIPIVVILQEAELDAASRRLLNDLTEGGGSIDRIKIIAGENRRPELFDEALGYLAENVNGNPPLVLNTLMGFLSQGLGAELWRRVVSYAKWNFAYKQCLSNVNLVVNLYNDGLRKLREIALNEDCCEHAEFPSIFKEFLPSKIPDYLPCDYRYFPSFWKDSDYRRLLIEQFDKLQLPTFEELLDRRNMNPWLSHYCESTFGNWERVFYRVAAIAMRAEEHEDAAMLWVRVVEVLAAEKLLGINVELDQQFTDTTVFNQLFVVYDAKEMTDFCEKAWFYLENERVKSAIDFTCSVGDAPRTEEVIEDEDEDDDFDLEKTWHAAMGTEQREADDDEESISCKDRYKNFEVMMEDLEKSIAIQRQVSSKFQSALKNLLEDK